MNDPLQHDHANLLDWCAVLGQFDQALLHALGGSAPAIAALLGSDDVEALHAAPQPVFRLRAATHRAALAALRRRAPRHELLLHERACAYFVGQLGQAHAATQHMLARAMAHVAALHDLSIEFLEWHTVTRYVNHIRATGACGPREERWLAFFEAYVALRDSATDHSIERMAALLHAPDVEPALRVRALHAYGIGLADTQFEPALHQYEAAYRLALELGDQARQSYVLLSMAMVHTDLGRYQDALSYSERSLAAARAAGALYREAHALYEIGNNVMHLGQWQRARTALAEAVTLYTAVGATKRLCMPWWALGVVHHMLGDDAACEDAYQHALAIAHADDTIIPSVAIDSFSRLGLLRQTQGRFAEASAMYRQALALAEHHGYRHWEAIYRYWLAEALRHNGQIAEAAAAYRQAIDAVEAIRSAAAIEAIKLSLLGTSQYLYESMVLFCLEHESPAAAFGYVERARARALLDKLADQARSPDLTGTIWQHTATLDEVQAQLGPQEVLLEYFTIGMLPYGEHWLHTIPASNRRLREQLVPPAQIVLFAITHDAVAVHRITIDPNRLRPSVHSADPVLHMVRVDGTMRWLYDRLIAPVAHLLHACRQLYLLPHGPLHYIPFAALRAPDGNYLLHAHGPAIALATSATLLLRRCLAWQPGQATGALAIGFDDQGGQALEHAEAEARIIAGMLGGEHWTGPEAKRERLLQIGPTLRWLHIASHANYDPTATHTTSMRLGAGDDFDAETIMDQLRLRADLVTLSACMSGFGNVVPGDELLGLQRALLFAGAPTVVCTLAKTRDTVALLVMEHFYARLLGGERAAAALRDALVAVRGMTNADVRHALERLGYPLPSADGADPAATQADMYPFARPEYWAPFILIGRP